VLIGSKTKRLKSVPFPKYLRSFNNVSLTHLSSEQRSSLVSSRPDLEGHPLTGEPRQDHGSSAWVTKSGKSGSIVPFVKQASKESLQHLIGKEGEGTSKGDDILAVNMIWRTLRQIKTTAV